MTDSPDNIKKTQDAPTVDLSQLEGLSLGPNWSSGKSVSYKPERQKNGDVLFTNFRGETYIYNDQVGLDLRKKIIAYKKIFNAILHG